MGKTALTRSSGEPEDIANVVAFPTSHWQAALVADGALVMIDGRKSACSRTCVSGAQSVGFWKKEVHLLQLYCRQLTSIGRVELAILESSPRFQQTALGLSQRWR